MNKKVLPTLIALVVITSMLLAACGPTPADTCGDAGVWKTVGDDVYCNTESVTDAPVATEAPAETEEAPAQSQLLVARDLGPWAPGGVGETFEVTCNELNCEATHVQLWWPAGSNQPWGTQEISVLIPAGLSIEVQLGAGKGFEYPLGYLLANIHAEIAADNARRDTDTSFFGTVDIDDLIKTGLVIVRFDRRDQ